MGCPSNWRAVWRHKLGGCMVGQFDKSTLVYCNDRRGARFDEYLDPLCARKRARSSERRCSAEAIGAMVNPSWLKFGSQHTKTA